ncbi:metal ABC transporter ATP-binding protein [Halobacillus salinarum]|uniref:Metal ABC transporter ATP-binding protein n=1 Tax=Halobacillus salinarum TaxID=2932257 RepID=A0ABY4EJN7_9BACI|nr:metal ABC transporter ATP-binding protein [Halobacillus salinarum]UOQ44311.1 metal ABC transporter ATP-binding protein [Halobacillus salinarum]
MKNLTVRYDQVTALENINLSVKENEFLTIIGPNGGGKSTLLKALLGLIPISKGQITTNVDGREKRGTKLGYVPQFAAFDQSFPISVFDLVLTGRFQKKIGLFHRYSNIDKQAVKDTLHRLELDHLAKRQIGELSGGQLQRVLVARALVSHPAILLLDEPTASVDKASTQSIYDILKDLQKDMTIIVVSHDTTVVSSYTEKVACLNKQVYYHGDPDMPEEAVLAAYGSHVDLVTPHSHHEQEKTHHSFDRREG